MSKTAREVIAEALREAFDAFERPVHYYVEPEARTRYDREHGTAEHDSSDTDIDFSAESWRIPADAILRALLANGYCIARMSDDMYGPAERSEAEIDRLFASPGYTGRRNALKKENR